MLNSLRIASWRILNETNRSLSNLGVCVIEISPNTLNISGEVNVCSVVRVSVVRVT